MENEQSAQIDYTSLRGVFLDIFWLPLKNIFISIFKSVKNFLFLNTSLLHALLYPTSLIKSATNKEEVKWQLTPAMVCRTTFGFYLFALVLTTFLRQTEFIHALNNSLLLDGKDAIERIAQNQTIEFCIDFLALASYFIGLFVCVMIGRTWCYVFPLNRIQKRFYDEIFIYQYNLYFYLSTIGTLLCAVIYKHVSNSTSEDFGATLMTAGTSLCVIHSFVLFRKLGHENGLSRFRRWSAYSSLVIFGGFTNAVLAGLAALPIILNLFKG